MTIDSLPTFSGDAPDKNTQTVEEFDSNVQAWVDYTTDLPDDINTFIGQLNSELSTFAVNIAGATSNVSIYSAGVTYDAGEQVLDPADNYAMYTSQAGSNVGNTPSSDDGTYWRFTFYQRTGSESTNSAVDVILTVASKQIQDVTMTAAEKFVTLPAAGGLREGADAFVFINSGDYRFGVKDYDGGFICSIPPGGHARVNLSDNSTSAGTWVASDGADLIMSRVKTVCNTDVSTAMIVSCKLTSTEVFAAWRGADYDGFCAVLTWDGSAHEITVSNILEFETTHIDYISVCRMTDTVAIIGYSNIDSDGYCTAVTYDGLDTLTITDTYEFKDADTVTNVKLVPIYSHESSGKIGVIYVTSGPHLSMQVLNWSGSEITSNTSETYIRSSVGVSYVSATLLSGAVGSASIIVSYIESNMLYVKHVSWSGAAISPHTVHTSGGYSAQSSYCSYNSVVGVGSDYALIVTQKYGNSSYYNEVAAVLLRWTGSTFENKREMVLRGSLFQFVVLHSDMAIVHNGNIFAALVSSKNLTGYLIGATGDEDATKCELYVISEVDLGRTGTGVNMSTAVLCDNGGIHVYSDPDNSNYLSAQYVDIG